MPTIDIAADIEIAADPADIAAVMFDPARAVDWMSAVIGVDVIDPALVPGARVRYRGKVLHVEFTWMTQVEAVHFPHVLALKMSEGPVSGTTRFDIQRSGTGSRVRIRALGDPGGALPEIPTVLIQGWFESSLTAGLERLKSIVEG